MCRAIPQRIALKTPGQPATAHRRPTWSARSGAPPHRRGGALRSVGLLSCAQVDSREDQLADLRCDRDGVLAAQGVDLESVVGGLAAGDLQLRGETRDLHVIA